MASRTLKYLPLDDLRGHPDNPKTHAGELIGASIDRFGYVEPQVLDERTGLLSAGHGRLIDVDPAYCDVILDRWERHGGTPADKVDGP